MVYPTDELILLTSGSKIIRIGISSISLVGRAAQGVRLVRLEDDQKVVCVDHLPLETSETDWEAPLAVLAEGLEQDEVEDHDDDVMHDEEVPESEDASEGDDTDALDVS